MHPEHTPRISRLWKSEALQAAYGRRNRFQLVQCAKYFLDRCETVLEDDYVPNDQDIVQTRVKTTGIVEQGFEISAAGEKPRKLILVRFMFSYKLHNLFQSFVCLLFIACVLRLPIAAVCAALLCKLCACIKLPPLSIAI